MYLLPVSGVSSTGILLGVVSVDWSVESTYQRCNEVLKIVCNYCTVYIHMKTRALKLVGSTNEDKQKKEIS